MRIRHSVDLEIIQDSTDVAIFNTLTSRQKADILAEMGNNLKEYIAERIGEHLKTVKVTTSVVFSEEGDKD